MKKHKYFNIRFQAILVKTIKGTHYTLKNELLFNLKPKVTRNPKNVLRLTIWRVASIHEKT